MTEANGWIDVTVPVREGMVSFPDNPRVRLTRVHDLSEGDEATVSELALSVHTGTHVDAPLHFVRDAAGVDEIALGDLIGPARVVAIRDPRSIEQAELERLEPRRGERLLFRTRNSERVWKTDEFLRDYVYLSLSAARFLGACGVRSLGVDYLSIAAMDEAVLTHQALIDADVTVIEGLDLSSVRPGSYELLCLPLRLAGADGAPARALLRPSPPGG